MITRWGVMGHSRFDYFNLDDRRIFSDHQPLVYPMPACGDGNHFYYKENRLSLTKPEDVGKRLQAVFRKKQSYLVFHWRGGALNQSLLEQFLRDAQTEASKRGQHCCGFLSMCLSQSLRFPFQINLLCLEFARRKPMKVRRLNLYCIYKGSHCPPGTGYSYRRIFMPRRYVPDRFGRMAGVNPAPKWRRWRPCDPPEYVHPVLLCCVLSAR